jgi:peptidoglycan/LPS O-acetylase OafA/YrhL
LLFRSIAAGFGLPPGAIYFPTPCRIDGLASGAFVATLFRLESIRPQLYPIALRIGWFALLLLLGMFVWRSGLRFNDPVCLTAGLTLLCVLASSMIVIAVDGAPGNRLRIWLENPFLRFLGKYSYGIYVLHHLFLPLIVAWFPVTLLVRKTHSELLGLLIHIAIVLLVSIASGVLSWHLFEIHFLKLKGLFDYTPPSHLVADTVTTSSRNVPLQETL